MPAILNYLLHLATAIAMVMVFFAIYTRLTPYDEIGLIRSGNHAAALALGGTLIGFALPLASALLNSANYYQFLGWGGGAMLIQVLVFHVTTRLLSITREQIEADNSAYGVLLGCISIAIGLINAGSVY